MIDLRGLRYTDADGSSWVELSLGYRQFSELVFSDNVERHESHEFLLRFANTRIRKIAERMKRHYSGVDAVEVFRKTQADVQSDWFSTFVSLCEQFSKHRMDRQRVWVKGALAEDDVNFAMEPLRLCNGHHRCLVYMLKCSMGDLIYRPVDVLLQVPGRNWRLVE